MAKYMKSQDAVDHFHKHMCETDHGDGHSEAKHHARDCAGDAHMETNQDYQGHDNPKGTAPRGE